MATISIKKPRQMYPFVNFKTNVDDATDAKFGEVVTLFAEQEAAFEGYLEEVMTKQTLEHYSLDGTNLEGNQTGLLMGVVSEDGLFDSFVVRVDDTGFDDTDPLHFTVDVKVNGSSILDSAVQIDSDETEGGNSSVTEIVGDFNALQVSKGDKITVDLAVTRTAPGTEMSGILLVSEIKKPTFDFS